ncbi:hypothetical protein RIF29_25114 [Crotalaria pallida]|uniref:Uncharacterized protein n=1 Tax=Crotalaria pallida TaxID=3830 RepID=A0AAN9ELQ9_CROPI
MYQYSSHMGTQWEPYMGISNVAKVVGPEQLSFEPINNPLQSTPPSFCSSATKSLVNFQALPQYELHQIDVPGWSFEYPKTTTETYSSSLMFSTQKASGDNFTNNTTKHDPPSSQFTSSLHSVAESFLSSSADSHSSSEKYNNFQPDSITFYKHFQEEGDKLLRDDAATDEKAIEISFQGNQLSSCTKPEKQCPRPRGLTSDTSSNSASRRAPTGKRRIRWTKDLHEPFMMIVNRLGGPEKAKPKAILEMMKSDNFLSISHVKSHLQKCRSTINMHKAMQERSEEGHRTDGVTELQVKM